MKEKSKGDFEEEKQNFPGSSNEKEERERERKEKGFSFFLRSTEIGWSDLVGPRVKAHLLCEGYAWAPKSRSFDAVPDLGFSKSRKFRV